MATLKELAERTGYAPATISRILTGDPALSVSPEARRRVLEEAGRLNYSETRSRRGRTPKAILRVGVAEMLAPEQQLRDPYYLYLGELIRRECGVRHYTCVTLERGEEGFSLPEGEAAVDGIVAVGLFTHGQIGSLAAITPNVVFLDSSPFESRFDAVVLGYELGISLALDHLTGLGHRRICFIGPAYKLDNYCRRAPEVRRQYFIRGMEERGLADMAELLECPMEAEATVAALGQALRRGGEDAPTAYLCANEESAIGALRALHGAGVRVPESVSVVSFNDTPLSALVDPPLTSVSTHVEEMARTGLVLLAQRACVSGREAARSVPLKVVVPPSLTVRGSSGENIEEREACADEIKR